MRVSLFAEGLGKKSEVYLWALDVMERIGPKGVVERCWRSLRKKCEIGAILAVCDLASLENKRFLIGRMNHSAPN
jgi:hypothetical protein